MTRDDFQRICREAADKETPDNFAGAVMGLLGAEFQGEYEVVVIRTPPAMPPITHQHSNVQQEFEWSGTLKDDSCACVIAFNKA